MGRHFRGQGVSKSDAKLAAAQHKHVLDVIEQVRAAATNSPPYIHDPALDDFVNAVEEFGELLIWMSQFLSPAARAALAEQAERGRDPREMGSRGACWLEDSRPDAPWCFRG
jgi:hypothetical protein